MKILTIDDEPVIRDFIRIVLEKKFTVLTAGSGIEGLRIAKAELPDLILLDILMPGHDGIACLQELRASAETALTPVLIITAVNDSSTKSRALNAGADDFIVKPFRPEDLIKRIEAKLEQYTQPHCVSPMTMKLADVVLDLSALNAQTGQKDLNLCTEEFKILSFLMRRKGQLAQRHDLANLLSESSANSERDFGKEVDNYVASLRSKLQDTALTLNAVQGSGFTLALKIDAT